MVDGGFRGADEGRGCGDAVRSSRGGKTGYLTAVKDGRSSSTDRSAALVVGSSRIGNNGQRDDE